MKLTRILIMCAVAALCSCRSSNKSDFGIQKSGLQGAETPREQTEYRQTAGFFREDTVAVITRPQSSVRFKLPGDRLRFS